MKHNPVQKKKAASTTQLIAGAGRVLQSEGFKRFGTIGIPLIFFGCCFIFLLFHIDPAVIHSINGMNIHAYVSLMHVKDASAHTDQLYRHLFILELTPGYLRNIVVTPGGWTRFIVTLCIYSCHSTIAGALVITLLALFFYRIFTVYMRGVGARRPFILCFVPAFFIMAICTWYELSYCSFLLPVAGALMFAVFHQRLRPATVGTTVVWLSLFFWIAWYLMQWGCLLLLIIILIHEFFNRKQMIIPVAVSAAVNGVLFYLVDTRFIPLHMSTRWRDFLMLSGLPLAVIGFFPLVTIILVSLNRFGPVLEGKKKTIVAIVRMSLLLFGTVTFTVWLYRDPVNRDTRTIARTVHHVMNGQWEEILHEKTGQFFAGFPEKAGPLQAFMVHIVNHALCRTGRLGDRLFTFPQAVFSSYDPLLMLQSMATQSYVNWIVVFDLAMDLGMVNKAEKIAAELMENMGPYPDILYRRALVQIAKDNREAAAVYLNKLAGMPFYRTKAGRLLRILGTGRDLVSESRIAAMRANRDTVDYFLDNTVSSDVLLRYLLQSNPRNKAAYDYLMTFCLLYDRLDNLASYVSAAPSFGYDKLPRYWEEALCLYQSNQRLKASSELSFSGVRDETVQRFFNFTRAWMKIKDDPDAAEKLASSFGDSYFYFAIFRFTPGIINE